MSLDSKLMMQLLRGALEYWGYEEENGKYSQIRSYSGRFMYDKSCIGVVLSNEGAFELGVMLASQLVQLDVDSYQTKHLMSDLCEIQVRQDSMGMDTIVYFPELEWLPEFEEEFSADEEDEEDDGEVQKDEE